jgi:hypothetical protein
MDVRLRGPLARPRELACLVLPQRPTPRSIAPGKTPATRLITPTAEPPEARTRPTTPHRSRAVPSQWNSGFLRITARATKWEVVPKLVELRDNLMLVKPGFFRTDLLTPESTNYAEPSIEDYAERTEQTVTA